MEDISTFESINKKYENLIHSNKFRLKYGDWKGGITDILLDETTRKPKLVFHGTAVNFKEYIPNHLESGAEPIKDAIIFTDRFEIAAGFSMQAYSNIGSVLYNIDGRKMNFFEPFSSTVLNKSEKRYLSLIVKRYKISTDDINTWGEPKPLYLRYYEGTPKTLVKAAILIAKKVKVIESNRKSWRDFLKVPPEPSSSNIGKIKGKNDLIILKNVGDCPLLGRNNPIYQIEHSDYIVFESENIILIP